jgi:twitching motility protein PilT
MSDSMMAIRFLLLKAVALKASDIHLSAGLPPIYRVRGDLIRSEDAVISHEELVGLVSSLLSESQVSLWEKTFEIDFAHEDPEAGRFRVNAFFQQRGAGAVLRRISGVIPELQELNAPKVLAELMLRPRGLVLVTGPTGSGKSTTLAAMLNFLNERLPKHIVTVEDPIEFVHPSKTCLINQRELGSHTVDFNVALRASLREDPDVILIGELRDLETIRLALTAAETGHLVLSTLHTSGAPKTIDRLIDVFPGHEKELVRALLAESLLAVISQCLVKTADGKGRVAAYEVMLGTPAIRNLIREGKVAQMYSTIQTGSSLGMQTLDQNLADLVRREVITAEEAKLWAR